MIPLQRLSVLSAVMALFAASAPLIAQTTAEKKRELSKIESAAKDATALVKAAEWAKEKGLNSDSTRLLQKALRMDPNHEGANLALGFVKYDGKWMMKDKAEGLRAKALDAEYSAKGMVKVDGAWVEKDHVDDAKKGIFHHEGEVVGKGEKLALLAGRVRHPRTGQFIAKEDEEKAKTLFQVGPGEWVDEEAANKFHSERRPWVVRTTTASVITNLPIATIESEVRVLIDSSYELVRTLFGGIVPSPAHRPLILIAPDSDMYRALGGEVGAEASAYGAFYAEVPFRVPAIGEESRPAICAWSKDWGPYHLRHAAALATLHAVARTAGIEEIPIWFERGVAGYCERHYQTSIASHFGKQHIEKGGVKDLAGWFSGFTINGDVEPKMLDYNIYQAGLVIAFCYRSEDTAVKTAWQDVLTAFGKKGGKPGPAIQKLERVVVQKEADLRAYLQKLTSG